MYTDQTADKYSKLQQTKRNDLILISEFSCKIENVVLYWIKSYLSGQIQVVRFDGCLTISISITLGVLQGSYLGPLLFNLFINVLLSVITSSNKMLG